MNLKTISRRASIFFLVVLILFELLAVCFSVPSNAASSSYSGVLDDLQKDPKFNANDYPVNNTDYSLEIICIAEGTNGELFIYVYQPCVERDLRATYINLSRYDPTNRYVEIVYSLYSLTWINSDGVFAKYAVNDLKVANQENRYYSIAGIYRAFDSDVDAPAAESDDVKNHVAFPVGLHWSAYTYNDVVFYECGKLKYVDVEILAVGIVRYFEGFKLYSDNCDSHFVAFSVNNFDVGKIYDATIIYTKQDYSKVIPVGGSPYYEYDAPVTITKDLSHMETGSNSGDGVLGKKYTWQRILTTKEFNAQLSEFENEGVSFTKGGLENSQFVFQFLETDYNLLTSIGNTVSEGTKVSNVGILRLHFVDKAGNQYNLGVVSDLVSDDGNPDFEIGADDNIENLLEDFWDKLLPLLGLIIFLLVVVFFFGPVMKVVKIIFTVIKFILSLLFWVISLPFKLISWLLKPK